ncbi:MAG: calcium-binding protein, partial [Methylacidiphilales bacterium]|nr:calcium-binding protein [Candidatus Methylacidiphilales bacterium]
MPILNPARAKKLKSRYVPGTRWNQNSLHRAGQFSLEALEPRCLLDANLYTTSPPAATPAAATAYNSALSTNLTALASNLASVGGALNQDPTLTQKAVPFLQQSVTDLYGKNFGQFLIGGSGANAYATIVANYFANDSTPTSAELATTLDTAVKATFGSGSSVTDNSTAAKLELDFNIDPSKAATAQNLKLGNEAQEFALSLGPNAQIDLGFGGTIKFSIDADLSALTGVAGTDEPDYWIDFGSGGNKYELTASSRQSTSGAGINAPLDGFGVGFGLIGARQTTSPTDAGGYVSGGSFALDLDLNVAFNTDSNGKFTLNNLDNYLPDGNWQDAFTVQTPQGSSAALPSRTNNTARLVLPVDVANPTGNTFISGLDGLTGTFTLTDNNLFNGGVPLVTASDPTLASLSRMGPDDLLQYVRNVSNFMSQAEQQQELQSLMPFLDVTLGQAYGYQTATDEAFVNPVTLLSNVLTAKDAPSTSGDPLDFSGSSSFKIYIFNNGALMTPSGGATVTLAQDNARDSLDKLQAALQSALPTISGTKYVQARLTDTASPRLELYGDANTTFYLENINPAAQTLNLGFDPYGIVFARNSGTITGTGAAKYQLGTVNVLSGSNINLSTLTSPLVFTVQVGANAVKTVTVEPDNFVSMSGFAAAVQKALVTQGLYDVSNGSGILATAVAVGSDYGLQFICAGSSPQTFTLGGAGVSFFNLGATLTGSSTNAYTLSSATPVVVSAFNTPSDLTFTIRKQDNGTASYLTASIQIPAAYYTSLNQLRAAIVTALQAQNLYDSATQSGVLVRVVQLAGGGQGLEFYGSAEIYELSVSGTGLSRLAMTATTATAPSINISVTRDGSATPLTTTLFINGNTTLDYYGDAVNSRVADLVSDIHDALVRAGLLDPAAGTGVDVRAIADASNNLTDTIEFFALNAGAGTGKIQSISTGAASSALTVTAATLTTTGLGQLNIYGVAARIIATSGEERKPNFSNIEEFVTRLRQSTGVPQVKVQPYDTGSGNMGLSFSAWTGNTSTITIGGPGLSKLHLANPSNGTNSVHSQSAITLSDFNSASATNRTLTFSINGGAAVTVVVPQAVYASIADLADAISLAMRQAGLNEGLLESTPTYSGGNLLSGISPSFSFPIRLFADKNFGAGSLSDLTDVKMSFANSYGQTSTGQITNLASSTLETVTRSDDLRFTLGVDLIQPPTSSESLTVDLPVMIPSWDGQLTYDSLIRVVLDDGVSHDLLITAAETSSDISTQDYADLLTAKILAAGLDSKLTVSVDTSDQYGRDVIRLSTVAGSSHSLTVNVPTYSHDPVLQPNSAAGKLGFSTTTNASNPAEFYFYAGLDNATIGVQGGTEPFTAGTGYVLSGDSYLQITLPDGSNSIVRIPASSTSANTTLDDLVADINSAIPVSTPVTAVNNGGTLGFTFTGTATGANTWQVELSKRVYLGVGLNPIIADNAIDTSVGGYTLATDAFFTVQLPDGTLDVFQVSAADTADNTSYQNLVDDINTAILAKDDLSQGGVTPKLIAYIDNSAADNKIRFKLSTDFFPAGGSWNLQINSQYSDGKSNAALDDLLFAPTNNKESSRAILGVISSTLQNPTDFQLSHDLNFDLSINGSDYTTVTLPASDTTTNANIGDLITDLNSALAATTLTLNGTSYNAGQFIQAIAISSASRVQLALRDDAPVDILNLRFAPTTTVNNGYTDLGFPAEESRIGIRGSDSTLSNIFLTGRAEVRSGDLAGTANFGFIDFAFDHADLDVVAESEYQVSGTVDRMQDLMSAFGGNRSDFPGLTTQLNIEDSTAASLKLTSLSFPNDPASSYAGSSVTNLNFGSGAFILIAYQPTGDAASSSIGAGVSSFSRLPPPDLTFNNTNHTELLSRLAFYDVVTSLWRVGDLISDWMKHDPQGPFASKLFFVKSGLVDAYDFGIEFNHIIDQILLNPPKSLQEMRRTLASGFQLNESDITLNLVTSGSGSTFQAAIQIGFDLVRTVTATLPLYVDLATLADRSQNSGLVKQSLLGLSALAGNPANPMNVDFSALSKLSLDMDIVLVKDGEVVEPTPVLNEPASGHFFETRFFLDGDSYTSDLPAGANHLRLGYSWINDQGKEVVAPGDVNSPSIASVATTQALSAVYDGTQTQPTLTASANGGLILDGITVAVGDSVLVKNQGDTTQNGLYDVISIGSAGSKWVLARTTDSLTWLKVQITRGTLNGGSYFMIKDVPTVTVKAATAAALAGAYLDYTTDADPSNDFFLPLFTAAANGALVIDGVTLANGDFVLLKNQAVTAQNGVYQVIDTGSASTPFKLTRMTVGDATTGKAAVVGGTASGGTVANPKNYLISQGVVTVQTGTNPYGVVALRPSAVAVNAEGTVALPDANGTPQMYDIDAVTTDTPVAAAVTVNAATTADLNAVFNSGANTLTASANGVLTIDGVTLALNQQVLVNNQTDGSQNGVYKLTTLGTASVKWVLTRSTSFNSVAELNGIKVAVASGGTLYGGKVFKETATIVDLNTSIVRFSRLIEPAVFDLDVASFGGVAAKQLPYSVVAASTGDINTASGLGQVAVYDNTAGTLTAVGNGFLKNLAIQAWDSINQAVITQTSIDGIRDLKVGDHILLMHQGQTDLNPSTTTYQGNYQNGIYEIVSLGSSTTHWQLQRVDFANSVAKIQYLRVAVERGVYNGGIRFIQTNHLLGAISSSEPINFSGDAAHVYGDYDVNGTLTAPWLAFSAIGQAVADLPLSVIIIPNTGGQTVITKDLGSLTDIEKKNLGLLGTGIVNDDLYKSMPDLPTLHILVPNDNETVINAYTGSGLDKFFNTSLIAVQFNPLPDLFHTVPPSDVLSLLRDWSFMGDALDLALFNLQFGMDRATGIELPLLGASLPNYTGFIEDFRDDLTTRIRSYLRLDPLKPVNDIRNALYDALGPNGVGYLSAITDVGITVIGQTWNIDDQSNPNYYGTTPEGLKFEKITGSAVEFSFTLNKTLDTYANSVVIDTIDMGDSTLGLTLSNRTNATLSNGVATATTGGVNLRRSFQLNFGFGMDVVDGFYIFNPTQTSGSTAPTAPLINIGIQAELDGDINTAGIQPFVQKDFNSQLNQLSIRVADGRADYSTDGKGSGFFGNFLFNLNTGTGTNRVGAGNRGVSTVQLADETVLGPGAGSVMRYDLNADADIHLQIESQAGGLIPSYQADMFYSKRFGTGSSLLTFDAKLAGLGDTVLGQKIIDQTASTDEYQKASPTWRINRSLLTANGKEGSTFIAFQNITIDVKDYLGGPLYASLQFYSKTTDAIRPFIKFMTTPIPGTEWMAQPFIPGDFLGTPFAIFLATINTMDKLLGDLPRFAALNSRTSNNPRVSLGGTTLGPSQDIKIWGFGQDDNKEAFDKYKEDRAMREVKQYIKEDAEEDDEDEEDNRSRFQKLSDALTEPLNTPNKFSQKFESFRDGDYFSSDPKASGVSGSIKEAFKKSVRDALERNDDRGGKKRVIANIQGGGFQLGALSNLTAVNLMMGNNADLLRVELPKLTLGFSYTRFFPLPAFPPLGMTLGFQISVFIHLSFGWDSNGFYWTNKDASNADITQSQRIPAFGISARFSVGVALNFGLIEVGVQAYLEVGVEFFWNIPEGTDRLYQREINWLWDHGDSLFDVRVYGKVGVVIYIDLTIPIPFVGPITKRIFNKEFSIYLFDHTFEATRGSIQLGTQTGDTLVLNMGPHAGDRIFLDVNNRNEVFRLYHVGGDSTSGEDIVVAYTSSATTYYQRFNGVKHVVGYAGKGQEEINADDNLGNVTIDLSGSGSATLTLSPLQYATVDFFGGQGSTVLRAGIAYNTAWGRSRLEGGDSVGTLDAHALAQGIDLIAGKGNTEIDGGTGADKIVSNQGSDLIKGNGGGDTFYFLTDFGRDRIYVTGTGNSVSFAGATLSGYNDGTADYVVPTTTAPLKFQFGPLVQSVKQGDNTIYFATDPSGANSIDTWTGGSGGDTYNVFYFAPGKTLNLIGGLGANFYAVYLGDPKKVYNKDAALNIGNVNINDNAGSNSRLLLTQTFADTISYDSTHVTNGREHMQLSGIERIDLDAGDSTLIWGDVNNPSTYTPIVGGNVTTGRIILVGNVNLTGTSDVSLTLTRTFDAAYNLNLQNANSADARNLSINIENPNPQLTSDLYVGASGGIYISQNSGTSGDGYGVITLNVPTGSVDNAPAESGGIIRADHGSIEIRARNSIGETGGGTHSLQVQSNAISASTSSASNASGLQGIYLYSAVDLNIRASQNLDGISTANGQIRLEVAPGHKLTYGNIVAGGGQDITIVADDIELAGAYSVSRSTVTLTQVTTTVTTYSYLYVWEPTITGFNFPPFFYQSVTWTYRIVPVAVTSQVTQWQDVTTTQTLNYTAGSGAIHGTGNLIVLNNTDLKNIEVGKLTASSDPTILSLTKAILDSWGDATVNGLAYKFGSIVIGRDRNDTVHTGHVDLFNYAYQDKLLVRAASIHAGGSPGTPDPGILSSADTLELDAYHIDNTTAHNGSITFDTTGDYRADTILINADTDLTAQGSFTSTATLDGLLQFKAGVFSGNGSVTLAGTYTATGTGSNLLAESGGTTGGIVISTTGFNIDNLVTLNAHHGGITQTTSAWLQANNLEVFAESSVSVKTRVNNLLNALISGTGDLTIDEYDSLNVTNAQTTDGSIDRKR